MNGYGFLVVTGFFAIGLVAGGLGRRLLGRLRRGAVFRPPACELAAGALSAVLGWRLVGGGLPAWWLAVPLLLGWLAVPLVAVDLAARRLPDALTFAAYPILGCALLVAACRGPDHDLGWHALFGAVLFGGAHLVVRMCAPNALGGGDVKLAGSLGAVLGALGSGAVLTATTVAALITLVLALSPLGAGSPVSAASPLGAGPPLGAEAPVGVGSPLDAGSSVVAVPAARGRTPVGSRTPLLRRSAPHGPGLLAATWLVAAFPAPALVGG